MTPAEKLKEIRERLEKLKARQKCKTCSNGEMRPNLELNWTCPACEDIRPAISAIFQVWEHAPEDLAWCLERIGRLERVIAIATNACEQIRDQKTMWPGEVDTLMDALAELESE